MLLLLNFECIKVKRGLKFWSKAASLMILLDILLNIMGFKRDSLKFMTRPESRNKVSFFFDAISSCPLAHVLVNQFQFKNGSQVAWKFVTGAIDSQ